MRNNKLSNQKTNDFDTKKLTDSMFWDTLYKKRKQTPFDDKNWKNYVSIQLIKLLKLLDLDNKKVCEVGGGDSAILIYLAKHYHNSQFSVIDFSKEGCHLSKQRAIMENVSLDIYEQDIFFLDDNLLGIFDIVISYGVVEHFTNLDKVMRIKKELIKEDGKIFTLIPNFSSPIYRYLCKRWSKTVFYGHVPHDMASFIKVHKQAGLDVISKGCLGSIEFGMLSMAITDKERKSWIDHKLYLYLTRLTKIVHLFEYMLVDLPSTKLLSPFMYVISKKTL